MAFLVNKENSLVFKLYPYRISDEEEPVWILTELQFQVKGHQRISGSFSMTIPDLDDLISGLDGLIMGQKQRFNMTTTDDDFILRIYPEERVGKAFLVQFWYGEPFVLMSGYRFIIKKEEMETFVQDLKNDKTKIQPKAKLH